MAVSQSEKCWCVLKFEVRFSSAGNGERLCLLFRRLLKGFQGRPQSCRTSFCSGLCVFDPHACKWNGFLCHATTIPNSSFMLLYPTYLSHSLSFAHPAVNFLHLTCTFMRHRSLPPHCTLTPYSTYPQIFATPS